MFSVWSNESWFSETYANDIPSSLEHMSKEIRNDVSLACFLKIHEMLEVCTVFCLVCHGSERNINVFNSHPLIEIVFNLSKAKLEMMFVQLPKKKTYHSLDESNHCHWKHVILRKLRVDGTIILFVLEPNLVDKHLNQRCTKDACLQCRILHTKCQSWYGLCTR